MPSLFTILAEVGSHLDDYFQAAADDKSQEAEEEGKTLVVVVRLDEHFQEEEEDAVPVQGAAKAAAVVSDSQHQGLHARMEVHTQEHEEVDIPSAEGIDSAPETAVEGKTPCPSKQDELKVVLYVVGLDSSSVAGFSPLDLLVAET